MESKTPIGIFLLGGPGSGKDYVLNNIFSRFDLIEVQVEHVLNGAAKELIESNRNIVINGSIDEEKMSVAKQLLEGYSFDHVFVSVTNKVSRDRNALRTNPLEENKRLEKWYRAEKMIEALEDVFVFNNSINLNESSEMEKIFFGDQIEKLLERLIEHKLVIQEEAAPKAFTILREKKFPAVPKDKESGLPKKYVSGLSASTAKARKAHWKKMGKLSDKDPRAYEPAPGDATAKTKPSKHTLAVRKMMDEAEQTKIRRISRSGNITAVKERQKENTIEEAADSSLAAKAEKSGISVSTLRKVYKRGVAAWNSGHRPGTTPQQWGHARVNSYINKGKTYHTADKDLREETKISGTNCKNCIWWVKESEKPVDKSELNENGGLKPPNDAYVAMAKHVDLITLPGKATVKVKAYCNHEEIHDFVTERMCCAYWDNKEAKRPFKGKADVMEDIDLIFERQLEGTDSYRKHAIDTTPGQVDFTPTLSTKKPKKSKVTPATPRSASLDGLPIVSMSMPEEKKKGFMPTPRQVPAQVPAGTKMIDGVPQHNVPKGLKRVRDNIAGFKLVKEELSLEEAIQYHNENKISLTENIFRPGSEMFFEMIKEAKRLYAEGNYSPKDEWEKDMLRSDIGEKVMFEGQEVLLDYPFEVELNEEDKTEGKGIGKPWREGGGGAVYVRTGDGGIKKVRFSQSGMAKKFNDPAATRSFVARHRCLTNKDKTSASYWACRYPRFFSKSGKLWW